MAQLSPYEAFGLANAEIKDRQIKKTVTKKSLTLEAAYTCVEDIGYQTPIGIDSGQ